METKQDLIKTLETIIETIKKDSVAINKFNFIADRGTVTEYDGYGGENRLPNGFVSNKIELSFYDKENDLRDKKKIKKYRWLVELPDGTFMVTSHLYKDKEEYQRDNQLFPSFTPLQPVLSTEIETWE